MISGLVLAAGGSTRLGTPKQLLELAGKPLLQHVIESCAAAELDEVVVVLGHEAAEISRALRWPRGARTVLNPEYRRGQSSSLAVGLASVDVRSEAVVILLGDQPGVSPWLIRRALEAWRGSGAPVLRCYFGEVPGHPVVAARAAWPQLAQATGDEGARSVLDRGPLRVAELHLAGPAPIDVDTWEDYRRLGETSHSRRREPNRRKGERDAPG